ncbi:hypothetical protein BsWGS_14270 [Bradybaena similaris]
MKLLGHLTAIALLLQCVSAYSSGVTPQRPTDEAMNEIANLKQIVADLSKQVMMQQFFLEERVRTDGDSGIKTVRGKKKGRKNYEAASHLSPAAFAIHDHSNYDRTVGLGEMGAVMNGFEFRTRHNDYKLVMPSRTSGAYHAVEYIPFPDVPPEVLRKETVEEQIEEMQEWFKAFANQERHERDYTKYFKPVMCYLEGAWTIDQEIEEPFPSDRHWLDADSWADLHEKNRFTAYIGVKHRMENIAFLPTTIMHVDPETGKAEYAQWNYRILCSPISYDIPTKFFYQEDDVSFRVDTGQTIAETKCSRAARFKLYDPDRKISHQILDEIFETIPGKDNIESNLTFTVFGEEMYDTAYTDKNVLLNSAYYHRSYKSVKTGAGGITNAGLGFNDENLWMALTQQPRVAPLQTKQCTLVRNKSGRFSKRCADAELRMSYAFPLEVIYMTPLLSWNPYNFTFHEDVKTSTRDGRNGLTQHQALNGIDKVHYYMTPHEFFSGRPQGSDPADTVKNYIHVQAPNGRVQKVSSSGTRIVLPYIEGAGKIRLRYPIAPVHGEGSSVWKELNALKDKVLESDEGPPSSVLFELSITVRNPPGEHSHQVRITYSEFLRLIEGQPLNVTTEEAQEHTHDITFVYMPKTKSFRYTMCDRQRSCLDGHPRPMTLETKTAFTDLS